MSNIGHTAGSVGDPAVSGRPDVYGELRRAEETSHLALLYQGREEQLDVALPFTQIGIENDERCLYVVDDEDTVGTIRDGLSTLGVDVEAAIEADQLRIQTAEETYLDGGFDPTEMAASLERMASAAVEDGFEGLRMTGETAWMHREGISLEQMRKYEQLCEQTVSKHEFVALCQYDLRELPDDGVVTVVQTHPKLVYRHRVCPNPYYDEAAGTAPDEGGGIAGGQLLDAAYELATTRGAIRQYEQRVAVLNRVLRHNLRNEMNVIQSHAELLEDAVEETTDEESIETILSTTSKLMGIAEDAKRVEKSVSGPVENRIPIDLEAVVDRAASRVRDRYPSVSLHIQTGGQQWVEANEELEFALTELFETLATLAEDGGEILVEYVPDCSTHARRCLRVRCPGVDIPDAEVQALTEGRETQMNHGSGLGLWLVNWIVELSGGELSFVSDSEHDAEVVLSFLSAGEQ